MGFFDLFKKKELKRISDLESESNRVNQELNNCLSENNLLKNEISMLKENLSRYSKIVDLENESGLLERQIARQRTLLNSEKEELEKDIEEKSLIRDSIRNEIEEKKKEVVELDEKILLQDFGLYSPVYDFANSEGYADRLEALRVEQKNMILFKTAAKCSTSWTVNGSEEQGRIMTEQNIKQILRCFNDECDVLINKVKFNNVNAFIDKIYKSATALNRMNTKNAVSLSDGYVSLKVEELKLAYEYAKKKQEEKDEQKRVKEQLREEAKLLKEIEEARREIEKERKHYINALQKIGGQIENSTDLERESLMEKKMEIESHLSDLDIAVKDIDYREANKRAGYVYVISNIGSFGEGVYKIGMTRRLDPMERVDELGDASVPFKFDVHAMIFSDDAPKLESALHHAFEKNKLNMVNGRREFFRVSLDEIESVVKQNYDKTVEFVKVPTAEQYRESLKIKEIL